MSSVYHNYQDDKFSWGHQDCGITTMYVLIKFKGTTVTSKIVKQKRKFRRYQNTPEKLSLVKTTTTKEKPQMLLIFRTHVWSQNQSMPHSRSLLWRPSAYREPSAYRQPVLGASSFYCASLSVEPNEPYLIPLSSHCPPAFSQQVTTH